MNQPPIPLEEVKESILRAFRELNEPNARPALAELVATSPAHVIEHLTLEHTIPGPSSVTKCRRAQWFPTHTGDEGKAVPEEWAYAAMVGVVVEPLWHMILGQADSRLKVSKCDMPLNIAPGVIGMPDGYLKGVDSLLELKASGSWDYIYTNEQGLYKNHMDHVAQTNLYMDGAGLSWTLIIHNTVAPALVRWLKAPWIGEKGSKKRDPDFRYPFFTLNWVHRDPEYIEELKERLVVLQVDQSLVDPPAPREFDPWTDQWPCQRMCRWLEMCQAVG